MFLASVAVFFVFYYIPFVHRPADGDVPFVSVCMRAFNDRNDNDSEREEGFRHHAGDSPVSTNYNVYTSDVNDVEVK